MEGFTLSNRTLTDKQFSNTFAASSLSLATVIIFFISTLPTFAQSWCDAGANWKYNYINFGTEGYTEIRLWVTKDNLAAEKLYTSLGFRQATLIHYMQRSL